MKALTRATTSAWPASAFMPFTTSHRSATTMPDETTAPVVGRSAIRAIAERMRRFLNGDGIASPCWCGAVQAPRQSCRHSEVMSFNSASIYPVSLQ